MALALLADLSPDSHYLHWLIVHNFSRFVVDCLHSHKLIVLLQGLGKDDLAVVRTGRNGSAVDLLDDLPVGEVE